MTHIKFKAQIACGNIVASIMLVVIIVRRLCFGDPVAGWASTMCVIVFIGAIQLFCIGIMGQYLAKTYNEAKKRSHYIISESNKEVKNLKIIIE